MAAEEPVCRERVSHTCRLRSVRRPHSLDVPASCICKRLQDEAECKVAESAQIAGVAAPLDLSWGAVYDEDWEAQVKDSYRPLQLLDDLWIVPEWCALRAHRCLHPQRSCFALTCAHFAANWTIQSRALLWGACEGAPGPCVCRCEPPEPEVTNVILKPGIAFGTGEHPTTRLCLRWLRAAQLPGASVVDYGCGSGILSVAACLYGARRVVRDRTSLFESRHSAVSVLMTCR